MRVAIAHDWLVRYAGSERCVSELIEEFHVRRLLTTIVAPGRLPPALAAAEPSILQRVPGAADHHQWLLPLMPASWRMRPPVDDVDLVISSSHACAKAVRVTPGTPHLCYCHTPMRYAWNPGAEAERIPRGLRSLSRLALGALRRWDRASAARVTGFVANSTAVAERIRRAYDRPSTVVHPPVDVDFYTPGGPRDDYFLFVGRLVSYKRPELVIEAFADIPARLVVVGDGHMIGRLRAVAGSNVAFVGTPDDERLRELYRGTRALVYPAEEDFGIVMAEAQACGTPVIGYRRGGAADIVKDGVTGWLIERQEIRALRAAVRRAMAEELPPETIRASAERFSRERFRSRMRAVAEELVHRAGTAAAA